MLTAKDNELLCRVGPGTPMGTLMRRYWQPIFLKSELPEPDGAPIRVRHLGENLIAWRNSDGSVGLMQNACPHRGASMFFGRNEENGLRCVYHGWKFDNEGQCVDMPNEPAESNFKHKIRIQAYPVVEKGGVMWTYMGPAAEQPEMPAYEWLRLPAGHMHISKTFEDCNWLQALEGGIDSSHSSFLHRNLGDNDPTLGRGSYRARSTAPARWLSRVTTYPPPPLLMARRIRWLDGSRPGPRSVRTRPARSNFEPWQGQRNPPGQSAPISAFASAPLVWGEQPRWLQMPTSTSTSGLIERPAPLT